MASQEEETKPDDILVEKAKEETIDLDEDEPVREQWSKKLDFLMSIIGFSVDLAGIWRL